MQMFQEKANTRQWRGLRFKMNESLTDRCASYKTSHLHLVALGKFPKSSYLYDRYVEPLDAIVMSLFGDDVCPAESSQAHWS